jgi:hypothetical protein
MVCCLVSERSWVWACVNRELSESRDGRFYDQGAGLAFSAKTRCSCTLCVSSLDLFLFRRTPLFYLHSACLCLLDTVVLEQCVVVDQSLSEGHCTLFMQSMSLSLSRSVQLVVSDQS